MPTTKQIAVVVEEINIRDYVSGFPCDEADVSADVEIVRNGGTVTIYIDGELAYYGPVIVG